MNKPFFSIVITAYNEEKYVKQCISSVINQGMEDFEIFFVNDCSDDNTLQIASQFKDKRIKIINMPKRSGVSKCRNIALDGAKGQYIFFLDGDDWIMHDTLNKAWEKLSKEPSDVLFVPYFIYWQNKDKYVYNNPKYRLKGLLKGIGYANYEVCTKFYSKKFLDDKKIKFCELNFAEDLVFFYDVTTSLESFSSLDEQLYCYRKGHKKNNLSCAYNLAEALKIAQSKVKNTKLEKIFYKRSADLLNFWLVRLNFDRDLYHFAKDFIKEYKIININSPIEKIIYKIYFKIAK